MEAFTTGLLTGIPLMIAVGPIALLLIQTGVRRGFVDGWPAALGVALADLSYATVAAVGGAGLRQVLRPIAGVLPYVGAAVLVVLATTMLWRAVASLRAGALDEPDMVHQPNTRATGSVRLAASMYGMTVMNPMTVIAFTSLVVATGRAAAVPGWPIGIATASLGVHLVLVGIGSRIRHALPPSGASWLQVVGALAIAGMATNLVVHG